MRSLIITWQGFQDQELVYPYYRLTEECSSADDVTIMANTLGKISGILGCTMVSNALVSELESQEGREAYLKKYDLLVLPGGVKALEKLRQEAHVLEFIKLWNSEGKVIASTCHGAQLLISAKIITNRNVSGYYSIKDDITNAGAHYVKAPVVVDDNLVTSPHYDFMGPWMKAAINAAGVN